MKNIFQVREGRGPCERVFRPGVVSPASNISFSSQQQKPSREIMCTTTVEQKNNQANKALHLSPSVENSIPLAGDFLEDNNIGSSRSPITRLVEKADGDDRENIKPVFVSFSTTDVEKANELDHQNSSLIVNDDKTTSDFGSISEAKIYHESDDHVGVKSRNFCADMIMLPAGVCQGSTEFAEQMDIFMRCQHPLDILSIFHEEGGGNGINENSFSNDIGEDANVHRPVGYYAIPKSCEYCGSPDIDLCRDSPECERPKTFFPREIPPFCSNGGSSRIRNVY